GWPLELGAVTRIAVWVQQHSMIYLVLKKTIITDQRVYKVRQHLLQWVPQQVDQRASEKRIDRIASRYRANVEAIADLAESHGIQLLLIRQPMTARHEHPETFPSYEAEYEAIAKRLSEGEPRDPFEFNFLVHRRLIRELDAIARERGLPVVDNIAIVDQDRRRLTSWVHLSEEGNLRLAEALQEAIEPLIPEAMVDAPQDPRASGESAVPRAGLAE
ncbi:MAG: SGNH/GDSL hydrolase family protein, partial [Vicinamibacteria bacterium]